MKPSILDDIIEGVRQSARRSNSTPSLQMAQEILRLTRDREQLARLAVALWDYYRDHNKPLHIGEREWFAQVQEARNWVDKAAKE